MSHNKRSRASVIVETRDGILLARMRRGRFMLPGGGVDPGEQPISAAIRELKEETGLDSRSAVFLFEHESPHYRHHVFHVEAQGIAEPRSEIVEVGVFCPEVRREVSDSTARIIERFLSGRSLVVLPAQAGTSMWL